VSKSSSANPFKILISATINLPESIPTADNIILSKTAPRNPNKHDRGPFIDYRYKMILLSMMKIKMHELLRMYMLNWLSLARSKATISNLHLLPTGLETRSYELTRSVLGNTSPFLESTRSHHPTQVATYLLTSSPIISGVWFVFVNSPESFLGTNPLLASCCLVLGACYNREFLTLEIIGQRLLVRIS
jgi:hypothetical protein